MSLQKSRDTINEARQFLLGRPEDQRVQPTAGKPESFLHHLEPEQLLQRPVLVRIASQCLEALVREMGPQDRAKPSKTHLGPFGQRRQLASQPISLSIELSADLWRIRLREPRVTGVHGQRVVVECTMMCDTTSRCCSGDSCGLMLLLMVVGRSTRPRIVHRHDVGPSAKRAERKTAA